MTGHIIKDVEYCMAGKSPERYWDAVSLFRLVLDFEPRGYIPQVVTIHPQGGSPFAASVIKEDGRVVTGWILDSMCPRGIEHLSWVSL